MDYALFGREGVRLPGVTEDGVGPLVYVDELPGWLEQEDSADDRDFVLDAAEQLYCRRKVAVMRIYGIHGTGRSHAA